MDNIEEDNFDSDLTIAERKKRKTKKKQEVENSVLDFLTGSNSAFYDEQKRSKHPRKRQRPKEFANSRLNNLRKKLKGEKDEELLGVESKY